MYPKFLTALLLAAAAPLAAQVTPTAMERGVLDETNVARANPRQYAAYLRALLPTFSGTLMRREGQPDLATNEGSRAVREAIDFLERQSPLGPLALSPGLTAAARDHARDQAGGATGHAGSDGSDMAARINRYGRWTSSAAENISYGSSTPRDVVIQLIVDDGVPSRGHRTTIFAAESRFAGAGCGPHARYGTVCVIDYSGGYVESGAAPPAASAAPMALAAQNPPPLPAHGWRVDPVHSAVSFRVRHLGISWVNGVFRTWQAELIYDPGNPEAASVTARIQTASVTSNSDRRDADIKSGNYLAVDSFPEMAFVSRRVQRVDSTHLRITGDLTLRGVTRPVTLETELTGTMSGQRGRRIAFTATTSIIRQDFGVTFNRFMEGAQIVGDEVRITIDIEASQPPGT